MTEPFTHEGPDLYGKAYQRYRQFAVPSTTNYQTQLSASQEQAFRAWVQQNRVPFDPDAGIVDYDMRGFWLQTGGQGWKPGSHFPDTWKTPYDTSFSNESIYATPDNPFKWQGDTLVDTRSGAPSFQAAPSGWGSLTNRDTEHGDSGGPGAPDRMPKMQAPDRGPRASDPQRSGGLFDSPDAGQQPIIGAPPHYGAHGDRGDPWQHWYADSDTGPVHGAVEGTGLESNPHYKAGLQQGRKIAPQVHEQLAHLIDQHLTNMLIEGLNQHGLGL